mgnify:CR=1 FL=1
MPDQKERHVLSVLVENEPGVLSRVVGLFSGRGYNIHSLNVAPALEEGAMRGEILRTVDIFRCKVIDVSPTEMTIEATGDHEKLRAIISLLHRFGIKEIARTGSVVMRRSNKSE